MSAADDNVYAEAKSRFERDWQAKIYDRLRMIPGVVVGVNVDLDPEVLHQTTTHKIDPKPVAVQTSESSETSNSTQPGTSGRPGAVPNSLVNAPASVGQDKGAQSSTERTDATQASIVGQDHITSRRAPLTPRQVQVVVDVPMSYYRKIWQERNVPAPGEQLKAPAQADLDKIEAETRKRVEDTVVKLLPRPESGNDPFIPVTVTSFQDLAQTPLPAPSIVDTATTWLGANWQTVAMVLVGVFSLMMLRSMMKSSQPVPAPTPETSAAQVAANSNSDSEDSEPATVKMPRRRFGTSGPTLRDELREIVQEDPDAAATVLRAWIGDAA
jgi:flagellar M-ring protein FliF